MTTQSDTRLAERPFGITLLAILQLVAGLFGLCLPTVLLLGGLGVSLLGPAGAFIGVIGIVIALLMYLGPLLHLIVAYGALKLRRWAWWLGILATGVDVLGVVLNLWNGAGAAAALLPAVFSVLVFIYLLTPGVRQAFRLE